jgi:DNA-binding winged helix-turn-helix (wHTH) protein
MSVLKRDYGRYPENFRARELKTIAKWIKAGESGSILGLGGAGKSNLLHFVTHYPQDVQKLLPEHKLALVHVDLNNMPDYELVTFYLIILRSLYEASWQLEEIEPSLITHVEQIYRKVENSTNVFLCQSAVRELLFLCREKKLRLVLILDPFDQFCQAVPTQILDNLRGLRDSFKSTLSYLVGLRREIGYVRDPLELGELYEILDLRRCWIGTMEKDDACSVIGYLRAKGGQSSTNEQLERLFWLTGGYPSLIRAVVAWLEKTPEKNLLEKLSTESTVQQRLRELWDGLTAEEQGVLTDLQNALTAENFDRLDELTKGQQTALANLQAKYLCQSIDGNWQIFSPLFARFISQTKQSKLGRIWFNAKTENFYRGETVLDKLTKKERALLDHFINNPVNIQSGDDLIEAGWPSDNPKGVTPAALAQAIRQLRKRIEPNPSNPRYIQVRHGDGYVFYPEGAPLA